MRLTSLAAFSVTIIGIVDPFLSMVWRLHSGCNRYFSNSLYLKAPHLGQASSRQPRNPSQNHVWHKPARVSGNELLIFSDSYPAGVTVDHPTANYRKAIVEFRQGAELLVDVWARAVHSSCLL